MKCPYCSNTIPQGSARCPSCGAPAPEPPPVTPAAPPPPPPPHPYGAPPPYPPPYPPPPPVVIYTNPPQPVGPPKSRTSFVLLGVFFGGLGLHNFYAGYSTKGIVQLLLTLLSCGYGGLISWIWAVIEVCTVTVDSKGVPMK